MTFTPSSPVLTRLDAVSRARFHLRVQEMDLTALTGQLPSYSADVYAGSLIKDYRGLDIGLAKNQPPLVMLDLNSDGTYEMPVYWIDSTINPDLSYPYRGFVESQTIYLRFYEFGGAAIANGILCYIGNAGATSNRLYIESTGTYYQVRLVNAGAQTATSTLAAAPSSGQLVELRVVLTVSATPNTTVQIHQSINGAAETSGSVSSAIAWTKFWGGTAESLIHIGGRAGNNRSKLHLRALKIGAGNLSISNSRELF